MKKIAILGLFLALLIPVGCTQNQQQADIDDQIEARLDNQNMKDVDADLKQDGVVELTGTVENEDQRVQAEQAARGFTGVKDVKNLIQVKHSENAVVDDTNRGTEPGNVDTDNDKSADKSNTNDTWVAFKTKLALYADNRVAGNDINIESDKGVVSLIGKVPTEEAKQAAIEVTKKVDGVQNVKDQLQIVPASHREVVDDTDSNITDNVENVLDKDAVTKDLDLTVNTNQGVVTLTGDADNMNQVEKAVATAIKVKGVKSVNADAVVIKNVEGDMKKDPKAAGSY
jgi:osmotically-inducible protein OsmY